LRERSRLAGFRGWIARPSFWNCARASTAHRTSQFWSDPPQGSALRRALYSAVRSNGDAQ
jgi:hypothetical protein